jgi:hypothetical protein
MMNLSKNTRHEIEDVMKDMMSKLIKIILEKGNTQGFNLE